MARDGSGWETLLSGDCCGRENDLQYPFLRTYIAVLVESGTVVGSAGHDRTEAANALAVPDFQWWCVQAMRTFRLLHLCVASLHEGGLAHCALCTSLAPYMALRTLARSPQPPALPTTSWLPLEPAGPPVRTATARTVE